MLCLSWSITAKKGRPIPAGEKRGPRTHKVTIYLTEEEATSLGKAADNLGFRSASAFVAYMIEPLAKEDFTGAAYWRLGSKVSALASKQPQSFAWNQMIPFHKLPVPDVEVVNSEQDEAEKQNKENQE